MAASADTQEATWLNQLNNKLFSNPRPTRIREDYKSTSRSKHIDTRRYFLRDALLNGDIILEYIPTAEQLADGLMKPLSGAQHQVICLVSYLSKFIYKSA